MKQVPLSQGMFALVDDEDFDRVMKFKWSVSLESNRTKYYAKRRRKDDDGPRWKAAKIRLHHFILDLPPSELPLGHVVDHCNGNGLDCRRYIDGKIQLEVVPEKLNLQRKKPRSGESNL